MYIHYIHLLQFETYMSFKYKKKTVFHLLIILVKLILSSYSQVFYEESTKAINASVHHAAFVWPINHLLLDQIGFDRQRIRLR